MASFFRRYNAGVKQYYVVKVWYDKKGKRQEEFQYWIDGKVEPSDANRGEVEI
jgi:hypothetical protein